ncbi:hypothetical protein, partial [Halomonas sp. Ps84H-12]|uniref:hypothetical protein n=1 Tax=Halomonas sp. Ps84H-12 TaxID=2954501 RepID=UPI002097CD54
PISTVGFGNNGLAKANLHGANDQKVLAGGDRESVGAGFTDSGGSFGSQRDTRCGELSQDIMDTRAKASPSRRKY